ncbi:hypothetical protein [Henriciella pelagia]|uniref:hypothetical protein n=1 Tax=Henriciella pelagia TaxID=1977912 RepID=UPI003512D028
MPSNILDTFGPLRLREGAGGDYKNGLCFMEAVSWLASEGATDRPECACPVLGKFAIALNDRMDSASRQKLLPLVLPMTGTRSPDHEQMRAEYIVLRVIREIVPVAFDAVGLPDHAKAMREAKDLFAAAKAAKAAAKAAYAAAYSAAYAANAANAAAKAANAAAKAAKAAKAAYAAYAAANAAAYAAKQDLLLNCIPILEGAIMLGPNASDQWDIYKPRAEALGAFAAEHLG